MSRWIVDNIPAWLVLIALLVFIAGGSVVLLIFLRRRYPRLAGDSHNDATRFAFGVICFVYAFFIGFMASSLWSQINTEDDQARTEGAVGVQLARDRTVFDSGDSDRIRQALLDYERAALAEWPMVADGRHSYPEADKALKRLYAAYEQVQPHTDIQRSFLATSLANLDRLSQSRTARVVQAQMDSGPPWSLWSVILLTSVMVVGCAVIYGVEEPNCTMRWSRPSVYLWRQIYSSSWNLRTPTSVKSRRPRSPCATSSMCCWSRQPRARTSPLVRCRGRQRRRCRLCPPRPPTECSGRSAVVASR